MCGLTGFLSISFSLLNDEAKALIKKMANTLIHRGPDDSGVWVDETAAIALGHRRLSILDLSATGQQPMQSNNGQFVLAFNGEIYNHLSLRKDLKTCGAAPSWRGHSDTETLLAAFEHWGIEATLQRCVGMFAIALWHLPSCTLTLIRDRFGEKPLYYGWAGESLNKAFVFGSELKALRAYPGFNAPVCRQALAQYLRFMYVPAPRSIHQGIFKLEPGCILTIQGTPPPVAPEEPLRPGQTHGSLKIERWWSLAKVVEQGARDPINDESEALSLLETQLKETVSMQSLADVPLGAFLSGGVDSSTIVALMQNQSSRPIKTFTIGFDEAGFDESPYALTAAKHLGTEHHEMRVNAQMALDLIPSLSYMYDEPFADSSQIPTHLVSKAARQHVTVALSGDAGDELFGGYNRYFWGPRIWHKVSWLPLPILDALGQALTAIPINTLDALAKLFSSQANGVTQAGKKLHKLGVRLQNVKNIDDLYLRLVSEWQDPASIVLGLGGKSIVEPPNQLCDTLPNIGVTQEQLRMMYQDSMTYLPDDILCKVDRAAMATSLETRVPFLDHRVAELAWRLPLHMKIKQNESKWALRQILYKHIPRELIERPKAGFAMPVGDWLRGPLKPWVQALLEPKLLEQQGYFNTALIQQAWQQHLKGDDHTSKLWSILMFQAWLETL